MCKDMNGTTRTLYVQLFSKFTTHYPFRLVLNLVSGIVSGTKTIRGSLEGLY
jgi:hypothetical protein